jgi:glucose-6-phosphate isomerase
MTVTLPELSANTLGQLLFMMEVQTAFAGLLYNIDPMGQPGVEAGKHYIYGLAGRPGFESYAKDFRESQGRESGYSV